MPRNPSRRFPTTCPWPTSIVGVHTHDIATGSRDARFRTDQSVSVELVVLTHPHQDHAHGLAELIEIFEPERVVVTGTSEPERTLADEALALEAMRKESRTGRRLVVTGAESGAPDGDVAFEEAAGSARGGAGQPQDLGCGSAGSAPWTDVRSG